MFAKESISIGIDCRLWNETGVGRYIRNLVWELAKIDKKNKYVLFFRENEYKNVFLPGENFQKSLANIRWHSIAEQVYLAGILEKEHVDIMHFPYFTVPIFYKGPFIVTIHDLIINHFPTGKASTRSYFMYQAKLLGYKYVVQNAIKKAKKIIAVTNATKNEIISLYKTNPENIVVTLEGVDEKITKSSGKKPSIKNPYFLYVGNAYPHKNLKRLLTAFAMFKKSDTNQTVLVLVGKEDYFYKRLKKMIMPAIAPSVLFYEKVSDAGLAALYHFAQALIIPSLMEGFGLPAIEAMANNCVVLASNIPSLKEVCKSSAIYFDPFSTKEMVDAMQETFTAEPRILLEIKKRGKEIVHQYSLHTMAAQTLAVYESSTGI